MQVIEHIYFATTKNYKQNKTDAIKTLKKIVYTLIILLLLITAPAAVLRIDAVQRRLATIVSENLKNNIQIPFEATAIKSVKSSADIDNSFAT